MTIRRCGVLGVSLLIFAVGVSHSPISCHNSELRLLELPSAHASPGSVVTFYGGSYQADTFVWCLDCSASMGWGGTLNELKAEVIAAIEQLSPAQEFSLVRFSNSAQVWSGTLLPGNDPNRAAATAWVQALFAEGQTCIEEGVLTSLSIAETTTGCAPLLLVVSDGVPECSGPTQVDAVLASIAAANTYDIPIVGIFLSVSGNGIAFMGQLSAQNPGPFMPPGPPFQRGDADGDGSVVPLLDGFFILSAQFVPGSPFPSCLKSADVDDSGTFVGLLDALYLLNWGFSGGPPVPAPSLACGADPTADTLGCAMSSCP